MEYNFSTIELKWRKEWNLQNAYTISHTSNKPKFYILDMFPYPSGAGLHVGHPLGYIASDIFARYKRLKGFNVLHPMGFDAFGLPAEQYALETGQHPAVTTEKNSARYKEQLNNIGFSFDWSREINTSDPSYYKWTQWIFLQLFNSWFNTHSQKATPIDALISIFETEGNKQHPCPGDDKISFSSEEWKQYPYKEQQAILMHYRLAYSGVGVVNWCEALGTVLANDEVINGMSERGGHPVEKKELRQWYLRITAFADRLLDSLQNLEWSDAMKEMQSNWIGKSKGAEIAFSIKSEQQKVDRLNVYTTRPDTIFGVDFMVVAPESHWLLDICSEAQKEAIQQYVDYVKSRSERDRMSEKKISGCFTGAYAIHPFTHKEIPIWTSEYVLAGYGTGAIMAVPCGDERDFAFANHFAIPITNIFGSAFNGTEALSTKNAILDNSEFLNGLSYKDATPLILEKIEALSIGKAKTNYKLRDAAFSRQRYWGEPFPIEWKDGVAIALPESALPITLPYVEKYTPGPDAQGPLANLQDWVTDTQHEQARREVNTMPGYAGSSWYFLRYMDPNNDQAFVSKSASDYWNQVDIYVGGTEHAVGHLLYSRMWTKVLFDLGHISFDEPFKKLVNQGMIQGSSRFVYRIKNTQQFVSYGLKDQYEVDELHVDVSLCNGQLLNTEGFKKWRADYANASFILENDEYICGTAVEKMSKSKYNVVNPDDIVAHYGADTFRMYEMFLGPIDVSKPWDTKGIEGVHRFLKKLWRLYTNETGILVDESEPSIEALKVLHKGIKKIEEDTERFSFNTAVSMFMITVNELSTLGCRSKAILEPLLVLLTPYAPHIAEELWHLMGNTSSILDASYPKYDLAYTIDNSKLYPIAINGKTRVELEFPLDATEDFLKEELLKNETVQKWMEGKALKKFIFVKGKMINIVI
jgi:leucyl-tRNA synthetase